MTIIYQTVFLLNITNFYIQLKRGLADLFPLTDSDFDISPRRCGQIVIQYKPFWFQPASSRPHRAAVWRRLWAIAIFPTNSTCVFKFVYKCLSTSTTTHQRMYWMLMVVGVLLVTPSDAIMSDEFRAGYEAGLEDGVGMGYLSGRAQEGNGTALAIFNSLVDSTNAKIESIFGEVTKGFKKISPAVVPPAKPVQLGINSGEPIVTGGGDQRRMTSLGNGSPSAGVGVDSRGLVRGYPVGYAPLPGTTSDMYGALGAV